MLAAAKAERRLVVSRPSERMWAHGLGDRNGLEEEPTPSAVKTKLESEKVFFLIYEARDQERNLRNWSKQFFD